MITKQQAAILFAYDYKLVDKEGNMYNIDMIGQLSFTCYSLPQVNEDDWYDIYFQNIGKDYFILARPLEQLGNDIENCNGSEKCSLPDYWNIAKTGDLWSFGKRHMGLRIGLGRGYKEYNMRFTGYLTLPNNMVNDMYRLHFNVGFAQEAVKLLTDNK